jgi:hypothetical protein
VEIAALLIRLQKKLPRPALIGGRSKIRTRAMATPEEQDPAAGLADAQASTVQALTLSKSLLSLHTFMSFAMEMMGSNTRAKGITKQDLLLGPTAQGIASTFKIKSRQPTRVSVGLPLMDMGSITGTPRFNFALQVQTTCTTLQRTITLARMRTPEVCTRLLIVWDSWNHSMFG